MTRPSGSGDGGAGADRVTAIPIPDASSSDSEEDATSFFAASPGASSLVSRPDSWRPFPPPMLASSFDTRAAPRPRARSPSKRSPSPPAYGAAAVAAAADALRQPPASKRRTTHWRHKLSRAIVHTRALARAPRELWLIFALKLLSSYAYFSFSLILTVYLTSEFGFSDIDAGWAYGLYGVMSTFYGIVCGWFIDYLGVRLSLLLGAVVGAISRLVLAFTVSPHTAMVMLCTLLPFAECLGIPIMTIGIKRYTNSANRTFAFSLFYSMMNVAALIAGPAVDVSRSLFRNGISWDLRHLGFPVLHMTGLRVVVLSSAFATAAMCLVVVMGIREVEVDESGNVSSFSPNRESPISQTWAVLQKRSFWRLTLFTFLLIGVRLVFRHLDATMPKYLTRQFGEDAPYGLIYSINPFLIIFLVPVIGLMTRGVDSFSMILYGSFVAAASPFWICIAPAYWTVIMFMVTLSLGEAVYSPRVYEYTMEISERGSEGLYSSLSSAPLFSVKLVVGGMSGWLLTNFMPLVGKHHGGTLWAIIGFTSIVSPILMFIFRKYISPPEGEEADKQNPSHETNPRKRTVSRAGGPTDTTTPLVSSARPPTWKSVPGHEDDDDDVELQDGIFRVGSLQNRLAGSLSQPNSVPRQET